MNKHYYYLLDVFTDRAFSGNPLAVFPRSDELDSNKMQAIANELNLSETVFVGEAIAPACYPIRIFTPTMELPFAGHPVIGTAHLLAELDMAKRDRPLTLKADVGSLMVDYDHDLARFTAAVPVEIQASTLNQATAEELLGLNAGEISSEPVLASCGLPYHLIELDSQEALGRARPSPKAWSEWVSPSGYEQIYLYVLEKSSGQEHSIHSRMFSTEGGVREDPATGSAAAALVGYLAEAIPRPDLYQWRIRQGIEVGRPSLIFAETERNDNASLIRIAGQAVIVGNGTLYPRLRNSH
ncbi:PhzF family phenazine biosynthesis protein [Halomonas sp. A11-A]|uniref:PhzF family phenazine biosynthesis protein n=1 Tax=Halomonas sp. A11-A TaxID=2183985 RepID=UPI000D70F784|nr:PhzF family phenazine biosynthesis protein [Halomonas sp. A11-A]PWV83238.1 trans-2,3-dihydro-3-hydroxyanthranilate isomerase [Halomonas sp. A11-A]